MTYATVVHELFLRFPELRERTDDCMYVDDNNQEPMAYVIFGDVLKPFLETSLAEGDLRSILKMCAYLEDAAVSSRQDPALGNLLAVEIGEWLEYTPYESKIGPWLGAETKRICRYVPGLAMQRNEIRVEKRRSVLGRIRARLRKAVEP